MHHEPSDTRDKLLSDILSYSDVDDEVERVYRAFLDSTLIEYALQHSKPSDQGGAEDGQCRCCARKKKVEVLPEAYWGAVLRFRRENLNPIPPRQRWAASDVELSEDARKSASEDRYQRNRAFLFWFDVRAYYWSKRETSNILGTFEASVQLQLVYEQALALKRRVDAARPSPSTLSADAIKVVRERVRVVVSSIETHRGKSPTPAASSSSEPPPQP
jgi:hypothetical protein